MSELILTHSRYATASESTASRLFIESKPRLMLLEDQYQDPGKKVPGETCIPAGRYLVELVHETPMAVRYREKWPEWFEGLPALRWDPAQGPQVPAFSDLRVHCGVDDSHTAGCPLTAESLVQKPDGNWITNGTQAAFRTLCVKHLYPAFRRKDQVLWIVEDSLIPAKPRGLEGPTC